LYRSEIYAMTKAVPVIIAGWLAISAAGCAQKQQMSPDEIPAIKATLKAVEQVVRTRRTTYLDSLFSSDAASAGSSAQKIMAFVYSAGVDSFIGFTDKQIAFRGDAARIDCRITGASGVERPVTITMRREEGVWLLKKIEPRVDNALAPIPIDTLSRPPDSI
jgi:hypothetical protein